MLETALEVTVGDGVAFALSVANAADMPLKFTFLDACRADFAVYDGENEVWRFSDSQAFEQSVSTAEFQPGEEARFEAEWPDPDPGAFTAEAVLRVKERDVRTTTPFSV